MKKTGLEIIESLKALLFSETLKTRCRKKEKFFTRKRLLTFPMMIGVLLNMLTRTLQLKPGKGIGY